MNIRTALSFPFKDSKWIVKLLIGGGLSFVCLFPMAMGYLMGEGAAVRFMTYLFFLGLLVAFFLPLGYGFQIMKDAQAGRDAALPEWKGWDVLLKDGLMVFAVCFAYLLAVVIVSMLIGLISTKIPVIGAVFSLLQIVVGVLILIAGPYIGIALCKLAETGQIASSFKVMDILNELKSKAAEYITVALILLGITEIMKISLGLNLMQMMLMARYAFRSAVTFPLVGLLAPFVSFWILLIAFRMYGDTYREGGVKRE